MKHFQLQLQLSKQQNTGKLSVDKTSWFSFAVWTIPVHSAPLML